MTEENMPRNDGETEKYLWEIHKYTNDYIRFADTKAGFIAGVSTALIGSLVSSSLFDSCFRIGLCGVSRMQWMGLLGLLLLATSVAFSITAIRPRLWNDTPVGFIFWGSLIGHKTAKNYTRAVNQLDAHERSTSISDHLFILASIAQRKYTFIDRALFAGLAGGILTAVILFMRHALR